MAGLRHPHLGSHRRGGGLKVTWNEEEQSAIDSACQRLKIKPQELVRLALAEYVPNFPRERKPVPRGPGLPFGHGYDSRRTGRSAQ